MERDGEVNKNQPMGVTHIFLAALVIVVAFGAVHFLHPLSYVGRLFYFLLLYVLSLSFFAAIRQSKIGRFFFKLLSLPVISFITVFPFLLAAGSVVLSYSVIFVLSIIIFHFIPVNVFHFHPSRAVTIYLEISVSSIVVAYFYDKVVGVLDYIIFHRGDTTKKRFSLKVLNQSRAKFSIYFLYFVALVIVHTTRLNGAPIVHSSLIEKAILESFATFLAFERIISNWNLFIEEKEKQ